MSSDVIAAFFIGLLGAGHCMGMCGGIASLLSGTPHSSAPSIPIFYNLGRILSYGVFGTIVGSSVATIAELSQFNHILTWLRLISALFMVVLALYLGRWWSGLLKIEQLGQGLWRYISPLGKKLLPLKRPIDALPFGFIWGWLPCGLVYSTLTWAAVAGSGLNGALIMLSFGLGTLPSMLAVGYGAQFFLRIQRSAYFRSLAAILLLLYATYILVKSINMLH
ncbi:sulfite exporter TauE/SafE family protein [Vibrio xiamenensis]|uniref:sulfite exporter TauE/SafE family protein n=1 Tax=Vibrio xiamenensis TaxID=861298 RepID=UPI000B8954B0|nr:sulfite exporter TauE/SafE family protein [Vibrio xiamenensis]